MALQLPQLPQNRWQGTQTQKQLIYTPVQQQQLLQAGLTYAQGGGNRTNTQFGLGSAPVFQPQTASTLQNYAYPHNYTNLQPQQNYANTCNYTNLQQQQNYSSHQLQQQNYVKPYNYTSYQQQPRDIFDQRVQNNVISAVSKYYNEHNNNNINYYCNNNYRNYNNNRRYNNKKRKWRNNTTNNYYGKKALDLQSKRHETTSGREVCWIYESQGKCRFGEKCAWLHLDRVTGQNIPTMYPKDKKKIEKKNDEYNEDKKEEENEDKFATTFDTDNVCWDFNTFVGCRKGSKCKWPHEYLLEYAIHPYTGVKLNGMAIREFKLQKRGCC